MRLGVLCSGGDSPGMNAALRGAVLRGVDVHDFEMIGFMNGWRGFHEGDFIELDRGAVRGLSPLGGIMLGTSRVPPFAKDGDRAEGVAAVRERMGEYGLDGFLLIGGDGTQTVGSILHEHGVNVVGLPKTIDNDLGGTDYTFGFDTAVSIASEAVDRLRTTGDSHRRCMVLEVMGRHAGWIALHAGVAGGAHVILTPEFPESIEQISDWVLSVRDRDRAPLVVVAEGFKLAGAESETTRNGLDGFGRPRLGGIAEVLAPMIEERTGVESRATVLGHVQRGGSPTAFDRVLATRTGIQAADAANNGQWGKLVTLQGNEMVLMPIEEAVRTLKTVPEERYEAFRLNFG